jgi:hypothetical protein
MRTVSSWSIALIRFYCSLFVLTFQNGGLFSIYINSPGVSPAQFSLFSAKQRPKTASFHFFCDANILDGIIKYNDTLKTYTTTGVSSLAVAFTLSRKNRHGL